MEATLFPLPPSKEPEQSLASGKARVQRPNRQQLEWRETDLDSCLPADHPARLIWEFVQELDLSAWYAQIRAVEGEAGRDAIDPAILMALWLYATLEGVGSGRALDRLCREHDAYRWLCGGVSVNYHTLADFRVGQVEALDRLLTQSVAALLADGLVTLKRVSQDGKHVRTSAGGKSFRGRAKLAEHLQKAKEQVARLRTELEAEPQATSKRQQAARKRAVEERQARVEKALERLTEIEAAHPQPKKPAKKKGRTSEPKASTTDAEARVMKMPDGGFRPAYDVQFATDTASQVIAGVIVSNQGNDKRLLGQMQAQLEERYGFRSDEALTDAGFVQYEDFEAVSQQGTILYCPPPQYRGQADPYQPQPTDPPVIAALRARMATEQAKQIYKLRAATSECVNAIATNRGMDAFLVRGLKKVRAVALWFALLHTLWRGRTLRLAAAQA
jgi:transposase